MSIQKIVNVSGLLLLAAVATAGTVCAVQFQKVRSGGDLDVRSRLYSDLVADILPPPEYVIEPFLEATRLMQDPASLAARRARLTSLEAQYRERAAYWRTSSLDAGLKGQLLDRSAPAADAFWAELDRSVLPAIARGDMPAARRGYARLEQAYARHRAEIDRLVFAATSAQRALEGDTDRALRFGERVAAALVIAIFAGLGAFVWFLRREVTGPVSEVADGAVRLSRGDYGVILSATPRSTELRALVSGFGEVRNRIVETLDARDREVAAISAAVRGLIDGKHEVEIDTRGASASTAKLADEFITLRDSLVAAWAQREEQESMIVASLGAGLDRLSAGDLSRTVAAMEGGFAKLSDDFNEAVSSLSRLVRDAGETTMEVGSRTGELRQAAQTLAIRSEQQAVTLASTVVSLADVTVNVGETAKHVEVVRKIVGDARLEVDRSGDVLCRTVTAISEIAAAQSEIGKIVSLIDGIAFQTNLLALNAGVEAARAGDAGKGFAVVANEVRALAMRCTEAATDIKQRIGAASELVQSGVSLVGDTEQALQRITAKVAEISQIIDSIARGAGDQAATLQTVDRSMREMDETTRQNSAMVEETATAISALAAQASALRDQLACFVTLEPDTLARAA
jgi:methyl-accepting chemotaxis protein